MFDCRFAFTDLCGPEGATQAIGFLLGLCSIPLTVGPPVAGLLYDQTKSYTVSFILAGIPSLIGALIMTLIHRLKDDNVQDSKDHEQADAPLAKQAWNEGWNQFFSFNKICFDESEFADPERKPMNGIANGNCVPTAVDSDETGISETVRLLHRAKVSALVMDRRHFPENPFQSKRRYAYGEL